MAEYKVTDTQLTSIADAIRTKGGTEAALTFPAGFVSAIAAIEAESETPAAAGELQILTGSVSLESEPSVDEDDDTEVLQFPVSDVPFTVQGIAVWHTAAHNNTYYTRGMKTLLYGVSSTSGTGSQAFCQNYPNVGSKNIATATIATFQNGTTVNIASNACFNGPYKYMLWGAAEEEEND